MCIVGYGEHMALPDGKPGIRGVVFLRVYLFFDGAWDAHLPARGKISSRTLLSDLVLVGLSYRSQSALNKASPGKTYQRGTAAWAHLATLGGIALARRLPAA